MGQSLTSPGGGNHGSVLSAAVYQGHADFVQLLVDLGGGYQHM